MNQYKACTSFEELSRIAPGSLGGWMTALEREWIFHHAKNLTPGQRMVEIGVFGATTLSMVALLTDPHVEIIGIDSFENETPCTSPINGEIITVRELCHENLKCNGVADRVKIIDASSHEVGKTWNQSINFLIVDGDHTREGAYQDLIDFSRWVTAGGILLMDDYYGFPDVKPATDDWFASQPPGEWSLIWGTDAVERPGAGWTSKMLAFRRNATTVAA